jgi:hypothetical protein
LFNPRIQVWEDHFESSPSNPGELQGKTPIGRATIARLQMNHLAMLFARQIGAAMQALGQATR